MNGKEDTPVHGSENVSSTSETYSDSYKYNFEFYTWPDHYKIIDKINRQYILFVVVLVSLLGNSLIIVVLSRKKYRDTSTAVYLLSLAFSDILLTIYMFLNWLDMFGLVYLSTFTCRLINILYDIGLYTNPWIMGMVSVERAVSVCLPHKIKIFCTANRARGITVFLWILCVLTFSLYYQIVIGYPNPMGEIECGVRPEHYVFVNIHNIANVFLQFLIPYVVVVSTTILIIVVLYNKSIRKTKPDGKQNLLVTKKLLAVNFAFLIFVTPIMVTESLDLYRQQLDNYTYWDYLKTTFLLNIFRTLRGINSGLNFFIYFLNGSRFRKDTLNLFKFNFCRT